MPKGTAPAPNGGVQILSSSAYKEIKDKARERGKAEALKEFAESIGFNSVEEMKSAHAKLKTITTAPKPGNGNGHGQPGKNGGQQQPNKGGGTDKNTERRLTQLEQENEELRKQARVAKARERDARQQADNREIEAALRQAAVLAGAKSDKAVRYLVREFVMDMEGKSEEELKAVDESKWFADRRKEEPYLFGEVVKPATTGTGAGGAPPPTPSAATVAPAEGGKVDAMKMNPREYREYLAKRGLNASM